MTLTEASYYTRRFAPFAIIGLLVVMILYYTFQLVILVAQNNAQNSVQTIVADPKFGPIAPPILAEATPSGEVTYILDTIDATATIQNATTAAKVIFLPEEPSRFGFLQRIYAMAQAFGFDTSTIKHELNEKTALFGDGLRRLTINITNYNFTYKFTLTKDDPILSNAQVPANPTEIEEKATELLRSANRYPEELAQGKRNLVYLRFDPVTTELAIVKNPADANMVEVDFYRPDIDGYPVVPPRYFNSTHYAVFAYNDTGSKLIRAQVNLFEKSTEQIGIYPVKTSTAAFNDLQAGKGYIVAADTLPEEVRIKKVLFAYLDPEVYQEYMQPVYVFLGDNNFVAYVPAVTDDLLIQKK